MDFLLSPGAIKKFRRTPWRFQQTVERPPVADTDRFIETIVNAHRRMSDATLTIHDVVFKAERIRNLVTPPYSEELELDSTVTAQTPEEIAALLRAALLDGPDFLFVPTPKPFVIYSDHDDYITFYANSKGQLNHIITPLAEIGVRLIAGWTRTL